MDFCESTL
ncbi:hypothetical protein YQE_12390, partial [Dendroctonus ponderosae]